MTKVFSNSHMSTTLYSTTINSSVVKYIDMGHKAHSNRPQPCSNSYMNTLYGNPNEFSSEVHRYWDTRHTLIDHIMHQQVYYYTVMVTLDNHTVLKLEILGHKAHTNRPQYHVATVI